MTHDSTHNAFTPWGEPAAPTPAPPAPWAAVATLPALLGHIVVMLTVTSLLTIVNLVLTPGVWWSFAILVIWLAVVLIHGIGLVSLNLLLDDDDEEVRPAQPSAPARPAGPPVPSWLTLLTRDEKTPDVPGSWELVTDDTGSSWPDRPEEAQAPRAEGPAVPERVPWGAATDIAWLRRPRSTANGSDDADAQASKEASS